MSEERKTFVVPNDIWVAAQRAFERGSTIGIAQAILEERERCAAIAKGRSDYSLSKVIEEDGSDDYWQGASSSAEIIASAIRMEEAE